jgi:F-type H+-transporting ATPase subunit gamma
VRSTREVKQKIRTVRSIQQICRAMKTVASIRLRRAEQRLAAARPYQDQIAGLASRVARVSQEHPFLQPRPVQRTGLVVIASDRGLAGGYNAAVIRAAVAVQRPAVTIVIPVGRRAQSQMANRGYELQPGVVPLGGEPEAASVWRLADRIGEFYTRGRLDQVIVIYSRFLGGTRSEVLAKTVLPVTPEPGPEEDVIFEPEPKQLLAGLMDRYLRSQLLAAVLEASASEHGARVAAMTAAADNAEDMIRDLTMDYNKARQANITQELTEIVSAGETAG